MRVSGFAVGLACNRSRVIVKSLPSPPQPHSATAGRWGWSFGTSAANSIGAVAPKQSGLASSPCRTTAELEEYPNSCLHSHISGSTSPRSRLGRKVQHQRWRLWQKDSYSARFGVCRARIRHGDREVVLHVLHRRRGGRSLRTHPVHAACGLGRHAKYERRLRPAAGTAPHPTSHGSLCPLCRRLGPFRRHVHDHSHR